jgi:hypothetical protein
MVVSSQKSKKVCFFTCVTVSKFFDDDDDGDVKCTYAEAAEPPWLDTFIFLFSFLFFPVSHCNQI